MTDGGKAKVTDGEKPSFFENFDLTFEYSPYNDEEESFLNKWYKFYIRQQEQQVSRPILLRKAKSCNGMLHTANSRMKSLMKTKRLLERFWAKQ